MKHSHVKKNKVMSSEAREKGKTRGNKFTEGSKDTNWANQTPQNPLILPRTSSVNLHKMIHIRFFMNELTFKSSCHETHSRWWDVRFKLLSFMIVITFCSSFHDAENNPRPRTSHVLVIFWQQNLQVQFLPQGISTFTMSDNSN